MLRLNSTRVVLCVAGLLTGIKLWLMRGQPIFAIGGAGYDDRLFLSLAEHVRHGEWLGPYTDLTLAKGPGYPIWIALVNLVHLPLHLTEEILYALVCGLAVVAVFPILPSRVGRLVVYLALLWNPMSYEGPVLGRVIRQTLYTPLTLLVFAAWVALVLRPRAGWRVQWGWGLLAGISLGAFWLTREEGPWFLPALGLLVILAGIAAGQARTFRRFVVVGLTSGALALLPLLVVSLLNWHYYGWFGTVEFKAREFKDAYGALVRVNPPLDVPFTPVTADARRMIYAVSPAFAELKPFIEGPRGRQVAEGNAWLTQHPGRDMELAGGWFMWLFRDAVQENGHCTSAATSLAYYRTLAAQVNDACDRGLLPAGPRRSGMLPKWHAGETSAAVDAFGRFSLFFLSFQKFDPQPLRSEGEEGLLYLFHDLTDERLMPSVDAPNYIWARSFHGDADKVAVLGVIGRGLGRLFFGLALVALVLVPVRLIQAGMNRTWTPALALAVVALVACACTVGVNALVDVSSFPNASVGALAQGYPLLILFVSLVAIDLGRAVAARRR